MVNVETQEIASLSANSLFEALTLAICQVFEGDYWSETMRPAAERITSELMKRFQIIPKEQP